MLAPLREISSRGEMSKRIGPLTLSERMARITKTNTKPELVVRGLVHAMGYRYRLHRRDLPGTPDLVLPRLRKVILVHGCFWHRHDCPDGRKLPRSKPEYWWPKLARNADRDATNAARLQAAGWDIMVVWECEIADTTALGRRLGHFLAERWDGALVACAHRLAYPKPGGRIPPSSVSTPRTRS
jgi:DNA mismatch endonuclease, patch repair protein